MLQDKEFENLIYETVLDDLEAVDSTAAFDEDYNNGVEYLKTIIEGSGDELSPEALFHAFKVFMELREILVSVGPKLKEELESLKIAQNYGNKFNE